MGVGLLKVLVRNSQFSFKTGWISPISREIKNTDWHSSKSGFARRCHQETSHSALSDRGHICLIKRSWMCRKFRQNTIDWVCCYKKTTSLMNCAATEMWWHRGVALGRRAVYGPGPCMHMGWCYNCHSVLKLQQVHISFQMITGLPVLRSIEVRRCRSST